VEVSDMFADMLGRIHVDLSPIANKTIKLKVATLCSGTDAPIFALKKLQDAFITRGMNQTIEFEHLYSCEIEPFKQAFIRRNVDSSTIIFRDVVEMAQNIGTPNKEA
jgi:hypothetical protein